MGEREDVDRSDSLVACGYGCRTTSVSNIHHLSVTPPFRRKEGATWVSLHSILLPLHILLEQFLESIPNVAIHIAMVF